jgi:hypothetical protein
LAAGDENNSRTKRVEVLTTYRRCNSDGQCAPEGFSSSLSQQMDRAGGVTVTKGNRPYARRPWSSAGASRYPIYPCETYSLSYVEITSICSPARFAPNFFRSIFNLLVSFLVLIAPDLNKQLLSTSTLANGSSCSRNSRGLHRYHAPHPCLYDIPAYCLRHFISHTAIHNIPDSISQPHLAPHS